MTSTFATRAFGSTGRAALALAGCLIAIPAMAQAPETQTQADPAPAEDAAAAAAGTVNDPGQGNAPTTQADAAAAGGVEEIVVTAQFREQNLQDTPIAITAVSGAMLEARSQTNISEVTSQAPSVTLKPQGAAFGPSLSANIRGVGQFDFNPALEPGVGVYVDDVYYATLTGSIFDLLDLERVEVLRGPQGTLAGKNSIGGAVKLYSKRPTGSNTGYVSATYGSRNRLDLRGSADFALTDQVSARIAGVAKKQRGYVKRLDYGCVNPGQGIPRVLPATSDCLVARDGETDYIAVRGQIRYQPNDDIDINLIGDYTHDDRNVAGSVLTTANFNGVLLPSGAPRVPARDIDPFTPNLPGGVVNPANIPLDARFICGKYCNFATFVAPADGPAPEARGDGRTNYRGYGFSGQVEWQLADQLQLVSISAYRAYDLQFSNDDDVSPLAHSFGLSKLDFWSWSQELRLNGSLGADDAIEYTVGGFYQKQKSTYFTFQDLRYAGLPQFVGDDPVRAKTKAAFAHVTWNATDQLSLTGGVRYTDESKSYTFVRLTPEGAPHPVLGGLNGQTGRFSGDRIDFRANVQYQLTDDFMAYAQISTGFKGGGVNPRPFAASQVQSFGPEKLTSYEVGLKTDLFDRRIRFNLAAFYSEYKDIQLTLSSCPQFNPPGFPAAVPFPCALPANAGNAHIKGFEAEVSLRPTEGFLIDASVSLVDFEYKFINPQAGGVNAAGAIFGVQPGNVTPYTPKWKWSVGAQYEIGLGGAGSLTPRVDAAFQDDIWTNASNRPTNKIEDYILANARLTWRNAGEDLEISGEVTNIFDKYYHLTNFDLTLAGAGVASAQPGRPREWAVSVKKKF